MSDQTMTLLIVIGVILAFAAFLAFVLWADARAERAHAAWMNHPDQVWNLWKRGRDDGLMVLPRFEEQEGERHD